MKNLAFLVVGAGLSLASRVTLAAPGDGEADTAAVPQPFAVGGDLIGITLNLLLVLVAIVVLAWIFKRVQGVGQPAAGQLQVRATLPLGPRDRIVLLQVGDEQIVVGASSTGLRTLHVLERPLGDDAGEASDEPPTFRERLTKAMGGEP